MMYCYENIHYFYSGGITVGRPSIFSRDYDKKMKVRKRRIAITLLIILLAAVIAAFSGKDIILSWTKAGIKNSNKQNSDKNETKLSNAGNAKSSKKNAEKENQSGYDITLSSGDKIKAIYENNNGVKKFKYIDPVSSDVPYSISPSCSKMIVYDKNSQGITYITLDGKTTDITRKDYTSHQDGTVYTKEATLKNNANYIWCVSPAFIDDDNIIYVSQLPWFVNNNNLKYVWIQNIGTGTQRQIIGPDGNDLAGQNIKINTLSDKGMNVIVDDKNYYIKSDGSISAQ